MGTRSSRITKIELRSQRPAFGGHVFGAAGGYELLVGTAHGEVDPQSPRNLPITDLPLAPRNRHGRVEYEVDIAVLRPSDSAKSNRTLLYEVPNRGHKRMLQTWLSRRTVQPLMEAPAAMEAGLLARGFTMAWSGWQAELTSSQAGDGSGIMAARFPVATADGKPVRGRVMDEFMLDGQAGATIPALPASATHFDAPLSFQPCSAGLEGFSVTVRARGGADRVLLPMARVQRLDSQCVRIALDPRFDRGAVYEVHYEAEDPVIAGLSFASIRDFVGCLKYGAMDGTPMPGMLGGSVDHAMGTGVSMSGRFLREFLYLDFNIDDADRQVFDGVVPVNCGAKRGHFHQRFAQPNRIPQLQHQSREYPGAEFPFAYGRSRDPVTGREDSVLQQPLRSGSCPRIMHIDGDVEQWQSAGCLLFPPEALQDVAAVAHVRAYLIAGAPHGIHDGTPGKVEPNEVCKYPLNNLSWAPVVRALVVRMHEWIVAGTQPPASAYPVLQSPARVPVRELSMQWPAVPGYPFHEVHGQIDVLDHSVVPPRVLVANAYPISVMRIDSDGNPCDGVVLPELSVPVATYSGRNPRRAGYAEDDLCGGMGSALPFAHTRPEREATGDPRPSVAERYPSGELYRQQLAARARQLVADGFMLEEDVAWYATCLLPREGAP